MIFSLFLSVQHCQWSFCRCIPHRLPCHQSHYILRPWKNLWSIFHFKQNLVYLGTEIMHRTFLLMGPLYSSSSGMRRRIRKKKKVKKPKLTGWYKNSIIIDSTATANGESNKPQGKQGRHRAAQALPGAEKNLLNRQVRGWWGRRFMKPGGKTWVYIHVPTFKDEFKI